MSRTGPHPEEPRWRTLAAWSPVVLCEALVIFLSSRPNLALPPLFPNIDKLAHFVEYAILGGLIFRALRWSGGGRRLCWILTLILVAGLAAGDETLQGFVPGRTKSLGDWASDCVGSAAGILLIIVLEGRLPAGWIRPPEPVPTRRRTA